MRQLLLQLCAEPVVRYHSWLPTRLDCAQFDHYLGLRLEPSLSRPDHFSLRQLDGRLLWPTCCVFLRSGLLHLHGRRQLRRQASEEEWNRLGYGNALWPWIRRDNFLRDECCCLSHHLGGQRLACHHRHLSQYSPLLRPDNGGVLHRYAQFAGVFGSRWH